VIVGIRTIDFPDAGASPTMAGMDSNSYALEVLATERLSDAREQAQRRALARLACRRRGAGVLVRPAAAADGAAIAAIWNREVRETASTTDTEERSLEAQQAWLAAHGPRHPVVVAVAGDEVVAFGALAPYRAKPSYAYTVENSVYVRDGWRGRGLGGLVLERLLDLARQLGHRSVIARVTAVNAPSLALHERHGFARVGLERQVACKHGMWLDVVTLQRLLID
jgi:L-amino acid N-acyltransferase